MTKLPITIAAAASLLVVGCGVTAQQKHAIARAVTAAVVGGVFQAETKAGAHAPAPAKEARLKPASKAKKPCNSASLQSWPVPMQLTAVPDLPAKEEPLILLPPPLKLTLANFDSPGVRAPLPTAGPAFRLAFATTATRPARVASRFEGRSGTAISAPLMRCTKEIARINCTAARSRKTIRIRTRMTDGGETTVFVLAGFDEGSVSSASEPKAASVPIL